MTDDERDELLIRLDMKVGAIPARLDIVDKRLDSHALDLKGLREWRNYLAGGMAVIGAYLGVGRGH